ncbi:MAG: metal ABC transporter permease [Trueperaceae bacterium]|nr:MAG: metal ABC transporter permease [Trueperaceae bacterium]
MQGWLDQPGVTIVLIGALVGVAASLLGAFLVLRRESMLSDAISHSVLIGIVLAYLLTGALDSPLHVVGAALAGLLTVWLTDVLVRSRRVKSDAAIGLVFPALFAVAVLLINVYARDVHLDTDAVLLGEIGFAWLDVVRVGPLEVARSLLTMLVITLVNLAFVVFLYKELKLATFDAMLATALGFRPGLVGYALLALVSVTAVGAFDAVGAILFVAFVIVPPTAAYLVTDRLWRMLVLGCLVAVGSSVGGYALALAFDVSIGGAMASTTGVFLLVALIVGKHGIVARALRRRTPGPPPSILRERETGGAP